MAVGHASKFMEIAGRKVGIDHPPLVVCELGINHGGSLKVAKRMVDKAALSGERLGASPAVIRWGISLEQKAQNSREMLAVETMWRQMELTDRAVPLADRRQLRLSQELTRLRSQLVPLEIQLPLPSPPFDEYIVESYAAQVQEQQKLLRQREK